MYPIRGQNETGNLPPAGPVRPGGRAPSGLPQVMIGGPGPLGVLAGERFGAAGVVGLDRLDQLAVLGPRALPALRGHHPVVPPHPAADIVGRRVRWYYRMVAPERGQGSWTEHGKLIEAIETHDAGRAESLAREHTERTR